MFNNLRFSDVNSRLHSPSFYYTQSQKHKYTRIFVCDIDDDDNNVCILYSSETLILISKEDEKKPSLLSLFLSYLYMSIHLFQFFLISFIWLLGFVFNDRNFSFFLVVTQSVLFIIRIV